MSWKWYIEKMLDDNLGAPISGHAKKYLDMHQCCFLYSVGNPTINLPFGDGVYHENCDFGDGLLGLPQ